MKLLKSYGLILLLSLLPLIPTLLTDKIPHTHDGFVHLVRIGAYVKALQEGQLFPRWAGDLNYGYGMPLFNFMYHIPYIIASTFVLLGASLAFAFKLTLVLSYLLSGIWMYTFATSLFGTNKTALLSTILYQFFPFRFVELLVRGSFGEVYTYSFLPLVLYGITVVLRKPTARTLILPSVAIAALILSHNSVSLAFFGVTVLYLLCMPSSTTAKIAGFGSLLLGLLLSAFYWLPAIMEHKYTYGDLFMKKMYTEHFPPLLQLFTPNITNAASLQTGGVSTQIGLPHILVLFLGIAALFLHNKVPYRWLFRFICIVSLGTLFVMTPLSAPLWEHVSFLRQFQFPWRLLSVLAITTSLAAASLTLFSKFQTNLYFFLYAVIVIATSIGYWSPPLGFDALKDESEYWNYPLTTTYFGETDSIWAEGPAKEYPTQRIEVVAGDADVTDIQAKSIHQSFIVHARSEATILSRTSYFPGWRVYSGTQKLPIEFQNQLYRGMITFTVPSGTHRISLQFTNSPIRAIATYVSLAGAGVLITLLIISKRNS